jgi:hypothetical protein
MEKLGDPFGERTMIGIINSWLIRRGEREFTAAADWEGRTYLALCREQLGSGGRGGRCITFATVAIILAKKDMWERWVAVMKELGQVDPGEPVIYVVQRVV